MTERELERSAILRRKREAQVGHTNEVAAVPAPSSSRDPATSRSRLEALLRPGLACGVGSLPHRNADDAAAFALRSYDLPGLANHVAPRTLRILSSVDPSGKPVEMK